ncbi:hypothetical protein BCV70DRAFT_38074 [Testicularia cyperi]|uniref:Uncharacterized protein n=1 Tax=Testicularia cyperi TaxID=1882483 RepID=A0A317XKG9_9BASI|nr:hypothetical protein BCV70DRAFT_38074 [Testicularia cyperi]
MTLVSPRLALPSAAAFAAFETLPTCTHLPRLDGPYCTTPHWSAGFFLPLPSACLSVYIHTSLPLLLFLLSLLSTSSFTKLVHRQRAPLSLSLVSRRSYSLTVLLDAIKRNKSYLLSYKHVSSLADLLADRHDIVTT